MVMAIVNSTIRFSSIHNHECCVLAIAEKETQILNFISRSTEKRAIDPNKILYTMCMPKRGDTQRRQIHRLNVWQKYPNIWTKSSTVACLKYSNLFFQQFLFFLFYWQIPQYNDNLGSHCLIFSHFSQRHFY